MAKPLGAKSLLIREAIKKHPDKTPKEIADLLNDSQDRLDDKIEVKPIDVSAQKQALKKLEGGNGAAATAHAAKREPKPRASSRKQADAQPATAALPAAKPAPTGKPVDMIAATLELARQLGGLGELKRMVEMLEGLQGK